MIFSFVRLATGAVFTFGKSRFADNTANKFWIRNDKVIQVSCGDDHTSFVTGKFQVIIVSIALYYLVSPGIH